MASVEALIPQQEGADLVVQTTAEPVVLEQLPQLPEKTSKRRLEKRFAKLTRRNHELSEAAENWQKRYNLSIQHVGRLAAENAALKLTVAELEKAVNRALDLKDKYQQQLRQRVQNPPLTPSFHHERTK